VSPSVTLFSSSPLPRPPRSTLFPYTTLFRSSPNASSSRLTHRPDGASRPAGSAPGLTSPTSAGTPLPAGRGTAPGPPAAPTTPRSEEHTSELQSRGHLVCRLLLEKKKNNSNA